MNGDSRDDLGGDSELTADGAPPVVTGRELVPLAPAAIQLSVRNTATTFLKNRRIQRTFVFPLAGGREEKAVAKIPILQADHCHWVWKGSDRHGQGR